MNDDVGPAAPDRLEVFIGEWRIEASFPQAPPRAETSTDETSASATFEWALDGQLIVQRTKAPHPAPDSLAVIAYDPATDTYTQHYFDSRGVVRVYAMTFADGVWTLLRDAPDFSPLDFSQRFVGHFSDDCGSIVGAWETARDGSSWEHDFGLTYRKVASGRARNG